MSVLAALSVYGDNVITSYALLFTTATAASINLCLIVLFNMLYSRLAEYMTEIELLRTQTEFDDSLTLKIYLLQFVNYYASIFYIAFFKGKFVGYPGNYNRLLKYRQEECGLGGCLMELCIQLAIIMVGKQAMNTALEMLIPLIYKWWNILKVIGRRASKNNIRGSAVRWVKDFKLVEWGSRGLFPEYLEMVLQYGFVTIFVAAFPLAPLFALLNNILEMRLDAKKLLTFYRRPVTQRVRDIGVWFRILDSIGKLSVITNGFIIAFTSNFIPKLVYSLTKSPDGSLDGFLDFSLSKFNTSEFMYRRADNVTECRYPDYREPPNSPHRYELTLDYWHILAARLAFVVVFENAVAFVMIFVRWVIPDMPQALRDQIRREAYITNEIIIKQESTRARGKDCQVLDHVASQQWANLLDRTLSGSQLDLAISRRQDFQNTHKNGNIANNMRMSGEQNQSPSTSIFEHVTEV
uniref:Anoctamin n=1 Tax=Xenopsylla cheopis TaxID=163159 RepID=A0A6M2E3R9_XENCH